MSPYPKTLVFLVGACLASAAAPLALEQSVVTEAVGHVWRIPDGQAARVRAAKNVQLHAPDQLRTERNSRAELEAPDGTITRVGANTLFAFDRAARTMELKNGSVLFHSPTGRGGGKIRSPSASAAVLGTTIIAATTPDGGFKLLVLEGRAQVNFAQGAPLKLDAGQMTFVRPGAAGAGTPGPVLNFDLAQQVKGSRLVHGFARPLSSRAKIEQAVEGQRRAVGQGQFTTTGFLVFTATSDTQVNGIEAAGPDGDDRLVGEFTAPQRLALNTGATLTSPRLAAERLFRTPHLVPASESAYLNKESDILLTGFLGLDVTVATPTLSLTGWGLPEFNLVGKRAVTFTGSTQFTDLAGIDYLRVFSPQITVPAGAVMIANFPTPSRATTFYFDADNDLVFTGGSVANPTGGLILQAHNGAVRVTNETLHAGGPIGAPTVVPSSVNLDAPFGLLELSGSLVRATAGGFAALADTLTITNTRFELGGNFWTDAYDSARLDTLTFTSVPAGAVFQATAANLVSLRATALDGFREINLGARTLVLESVNFGAGSTVRLVSEQGRLAPLPNTGATVQPGLVNFVRAVTYAGRPAQDYVATAAGGTGLQPTAIQVSKPTPGL
jgi:hypothetical protein